MGKQPSKRARKRDLQWFRQGEARTLLAVCQALKPRWVAFLMVCFGGGLRWGETTALLGPDIDWARERVHVARTWSEGGGRVEPCKDSEDRWVKLPPATMAALRAHLEAKDLEGSVKGWPPAARHLVFPNTVGRTPAMGASSSWCGSRSWPPRSCRTGSRTPCATATRRGCSRRARTFGGSRSSSATRASRRRRRPTAKPSATSSTASADRGGARHGRVREARRVSAGAGPEGR